jgi:hypothetical protein
MYAFQCHSIRHTVIVARVFGVVMMLIANNA